MDFRYLSFATNVTEVQTIRYVAKKKRKAGVVLVGGAVCVKHREYYVLLNGTVLLLSCLLK